jgi:hypothetical protein
MRDARWFLICFLVQGHPRRMTRLFGSKDILEDHQIQFSHVSDLFDSFASLRMGFF